MNLNKKMGFLGTMTPIIALPAVVSCGATVNAEVNERWQELFNSIYDFQNYKVIALLKNDEIKFRIYDDFQLNNTREYLFSGPAQIIDNKFQDETDKGEVLEYFKSNEYTIESIEDIYEDLLEQVSGYDEIIKKYSSEEDEYEVSLADAIKETADILENDQLSLNEITEKISALISPLTQSIISTDHKTNYDPNIQLAWNYGIFSLANKEEVNENISYIWEILTNTHLPVIMEVKKLLIGLK